MAQPLLGSRNGGLFESDLGKSSQSNLFGEAYPDRYFNLGIAELNTMAAAAGMAPRILRVLTASWPKVARKRIMHILWRVALALRRCGTASRAPACASAPHVPEGYRARARECYPADAPGSGTAPGAGLPRARSAR